ncbi:helix-turn-helix domain-containing protein [Salinicoccus sp. HZC-1]|uniref:helix-turn-helix domain-containing protein n=1 Tax=Salinicoccus sp. HZC-1 TaxID=3385497 RepID=UPI00398B064F
MANKQFSLEEKLAVIDAVNAGGSPSEVMKTYGVSKSTLHRWRQKYNKYGREGLKKAKSHRPYPRAFKEAVAKAYLDGGTTAATLARKYDIPSDRTVRDWIMRYNNGEELRTTREGASPLTKGRKTTVQERIEIAKYHAQGDISYRELAERFDVSYQQARTIVIKYRDYGEMGLEDKRGRRKSEDQLTESEQLNREISKLRADKRKLEVENALLKKLDELERN